MAKKRNPQDATRRNVAAAKRRTTILEARVGHLERKIDALEATTAKETGELQRAFTLLEEQFKNSLTPPA